MFNYKIHAETHRKNVVKNQRLFSLQHEQYISMPSKCEQKNATQKSGQTISAFQLFDQPI